MICLEVKWPLTSLWLSGHEKYPNLIADVLPLGVRPWLFDVEAIWLTNVYPTLSATYGIFTSK